MDGSQGRDFFNHTKILNSHNHMYGKSENKDIKHTAVIAALKKHVEMCLRDFLKSGDLAKNYATLTKENLPGLEFDLSSWLNQLGVYGGVFLVYDPENKKFIPSALIDQETDVTKFRRGWLETDLFFLPNCDAEYLNKQEFIQEIKKYYSEKDTTFLPSGSDYEIVMPKFIYWLDENYVNTGDSSDDETLTWLKIFDELKKDLWEEIKFINNEEIAYFTWAWQLLSQNDTKILKNDLIDAYKKIILNFLEVYENDYTSLSSPQWLENLDPSSESVLIRFLNKVYSISELGIYKPDCPKFNTLSEDDRKYLEEKLHLLGRFPIKAILPLLDLLKISGNGGIESFPSFALFPLHISSRFTHQGKIIRNLVPLKNMIQNSNLYYEHKTMHCLIGAFFGDKRKIRENKDVIRAALQILSFPIVDRFFYGEQKDLGEVEAVNATLRAFRHDFKNLGVSFHDHWLIDLKKMRRDTTFDSAKLSIDSIEEKLVSLFPDLNHYDWRLAPISDLFNILGNSFKIWGSGTDDSATEKIGDLIRESIKLSVDSVTILKLKGKAVVNTVTRKEILEIMETRSRRCKELERSINPIWYQWNISGYRKEDRRNLLKLFYRLFVEALVNGRDRFLFENNHLIAGSLKIELEYAKDKDIFVLDITWSNNAEKPDHDKKIISDSMVGNGREVLKKLVKDMGGIYESPVFKDGIYSQRIRQLKIHAG